MTTARARRLEHTHTTRRRGRHPVGARLQAPRAHAAPAAPQRAASEARRGLRTAPERAAPDDRVSSFAWRRQACPSAKRSARRRHAAAGWNGRLLYHRRRARRARLELSGLVHPGPCQAPPPKAQWVGSSHLKHRCESADETVASVAAAHGATAQDVVFMNAHRFPKLAPDSTLKKGTTLLAPHAGARRLRRAPPSASADRLKAWGAVLLALAARGDLHGSPQAAAEG